MQVWAEKDHETYPFALSTGIRQANVETQPSVLEEMLKEKLDQINNGNPPKKETTRKIRFVREGVNTAAKNGNAKKVNERWEGKWKVAVDLETPLVFPLVATAQRPDIVMWSDDKKRALLMELTVSWEDNIKAAEDRKAERYKDLIERCEEAGWEVEYHHIGIGARGFVDKSVCYLIRNRLGFTQSEASKVIKETQKTVKKASMWLWLKRDDSSWSERPTSN